MNKRKKVKYTEDVKSEHYCLRCGSYNVDVLSTKEVICKEKNCLAITKIDWDENTLNIKFEVKEK